ncbi:MAG: hypothetical protein ACRDRH_29635 [Pseudonocardia sp.]
MSEWTFRLIIAGIELTDADLGALFEAGCDDATFARERTGSVLSLFDREADTPEAAVLSALADVEAAGISARVVRVAVEDDWLSAAEVAERVGRTRQSIGQLVRGDRGPGGFPAPVARQGSSNSLWSWLEVAAWFSSYEPAAVPAAGPTLSPDFLAEVNDRLDLRERRRHAPDAPWRPELDEALPLVS